MAQTLHPGWGECREGCKKGCREERREGYREGCRQGCRCLPTAQRSVAIAAIAQLAARRSHNPKVVSSILTRRMKAKSADHCNNCPSSGKETGNTMSISNRIHTCIHACMYV